MKGLIVLICLAYGMGVIVETSSSFVPSGEKSKPSPMMRPSMTMTPPSLPVQQLQMNDRKDYVQGDMNQMTQQMQMNDKKDSERPLQTNDNTDDYSNSNDSDQVSQNAPSGNDQVYQNDNGDARQGIMNQRRRFRIKKI